MSKHQDDTPSEPHSSSETMNSIQWRVRCSLVGQQATKEFQETAALLRGIAALYGDGFEIANSASIASSDTQQPRANAVDLHMICTTGAITEEITASGAQQISSILRAVVERQLHGSSVLLGRSVAPMQSPPPEFEAPIKIFVSGDRSQVGKSTCCLGLVGSLLSIGYQPHEIAYIKPATQCEQPQLIAKFCRHMGIECCDIGPIVFYSGFTREFLKGATESSDELLAKAKAKVEEVGRGKRIVVVDGVGYPAVGSICGVSNASVALAVEAPVVLVGKKGVGDAVDSFNLNSTFFESQGVKVLGAIFNRLPIDGFYSLENCRESVLQYFQLYQPQKRVYGFIPEITDAAESDEAMVVDDACCDGQTAPSEHITGVELRLAQQVISLFSRSVNVTQLVADATLHKANGTVTQANAIPTLAPLNKRPRPSGNASGSTLSTKKSRQEIQAAAKASGAAGG